MPLYEYHCPKCSEEFELLIFGDQIPRCPHCNGKKLKRQLSAAAGRVRSAASEHCPGPNDACGFTGACRGCPKT